MNKYEYGINKINELTIKAHQKNISIFERKRIQNKIQKLEDAIADYRLDELEDIVKE